MKKKVLLATLLSTFLVGCSLNNNSNNGTNSDDIEQSEDINVSSISLNKSSLSLKVNEQERLILNINPTNATNKKVSWNSSNNNVATVTQDGLVFARSIGNATITVTSEDGNKSATCEITVSGLDENDNENIPDNNEPTDNVNKEFSLTNSLGEEVTPKGNIYEITDGGVYKVSGKLEGQIYINTPELKTELDLNGVSITYSENSPIYVEDASKVEIKSQNGKDNFIKDTRKVMTTEDETQGKGAIHSNSDLSFTGKGSLSIEAGYNNGVHTKDDLEFKNTSLFVKAVNNGIKANDSFYMESGLISIDCGNDGIKTENTDLSEKGKQRGDITILDGTLTINSVCDAISAAHDFISEGGNFEIKTDKFSSYSGDTPITGEDTSNFTKMYLKTTTNSSSYRYSVYIPATETWCDAKFKEQQGGNRPGSQTSYIYELSRPISATNFQLYRFGTSMSNSTTTYNAVSDLTNFNATRDMCTVSYYNGKLSISSWTNYTQSSGGGGGWGGPQQDGNNDKADGSAKGIKAYNEVTINGGTFAITAYDDGVHAKSGETLENGSISTGNVSINGGNLTLSVSDDGLHADGILHITNGTVNIKECYEGIEGNSVVIDGGSTTLIAKDDGCNAMTKITINGGFLDVTVNPSGDTDGLDSNGTILQTGGVVVVRGPASGGAWAVDSESSITLKGGTIICLGGFERTPSVTNMTLTSNLSKHSVGDQTVTIGDLVVNFTNKYSYARTIVYSELGTAR